MTTAKTITAKRVAGLFAALALAAPAVAMASTGTHEARGHAPAAVTQQKAGMSKAADKKAKGAKDSAATTAPAKKPVIDKAPVAH